MRTTMAGTIILRSTSVQHQTSTPFDNAHHPAALDGMDDERLYTPIGQPPIPRHVLQGQASPRKSFGPVAAPELEGKQRSLAPVKIRHHQRSAQRLPTMKAGLNAADPYNQITKQDRRRRPPPPSLENSSNGTWPGVSPRLALSRLESLPTELLEIIFFYTLTLGHGCAFLKLPRASLPLGRQLSSDHVRKELFLRMCSDPQPSTNHKHSHVMNNFNNEHAKTQSWILRQKWLTHDFVRQCIPGHLVSTLVRELTKHKVHWLATDAPLVTLDLEPAIHKYIDDLCKKSSPWPSSPEGHWVEHQWAEPAPSQRQIMLGISPSTGLISLRISYDNYRLTVSRWRIVSLNLATQIPSHLLHGPWTLPKIELLELLIRGGASVDWIHSTAGEVAERGFYDALQENNARALRSLCICDNVTILGERKDITYTAVPYRGVGVVPEQIHLLAAIDNGCQEDIIETLLNAPKSGCDLQDVQVSRRVNEMEKRGWLRQAMWLAERMDRDRLHRMLRTGKPTL